MKSYKLKYPYKTPINGVMTEVTEIPIPEKVTFGKIRGVRCLSMSMLSNDMFLATCEMDEASTFDMDIRDVQEYINVCEKEVYTPTDKVKAFEFPSDLKAVRGIIAQITVDKSTPFEYAAQFLKVQGVDIDDDMDARALVIPLQEVMFKYFGGK
jgi:hypothetical protein